MPRISRICTGVFYGSVYGINYQFSLKNMFLFSLAYCKMSEPYSYYFVEVPSTELNPRDTMKVLGEIIISPT